ncbi:hypothetical protein KR093_001182 [Drosophila rubida]|uniref:Peptidase M14 domain-containing protein n=1 Tax=Drosophila rubida TaxID=30044 RepID=A0AAD4PJ54_9MUSC|nr:hypothetical protein KR093_001182 [Drosophila rubida]
MSSLKHFALLLLALLLQSVGLLAWQDYKDYKVFELQAHDAGQLKMLRQLAREKPHWDILGSRRTHNGLRVLVSPTQVDDLLALLQEKQLEHQLLLDDISELLLAQREENRRSKLRLQLPQIDVFGAFYTHTEINAYLDSLPQRFPRRALVKQFGWSYERRPLKLLTISNGDGRSNKPVIFIDAAMHAREWIAPSLALYIIQELLEKPEEHAELLKDYDWIIMPVVNADGYEYTHTDSRYWRKTRKPTSDPNNTGTDLNRNFGYMWGQDDGSSSDPAEEIYRGEHAFDQPESQVVRDVLLTYSDRLTFYLSLHSYGNYLLLPWGHTSELPDTWRDLHEVGKAGADAIKAATGTDYSVGCSTTLLYEAAGASDDYAFNAGFPISFTMELPAGGQNYFDPPPSDIDRLVKETWIGIRAMAQKVVRKYPIDARSNAP